MKYNILINSLGGAGGQCFVKILDKEKFRFIGCDATNKAVFKSRVDKFYKVPFADEDNFSDVMLEIIERENIALLIPIMEVGTRRFAADRGKLKTKALVSPIEVIDIFQDKKKTYDFFTRNSVRVPKLYTEPKYPLILKPTHSQGSVNTFICKNERDFEYYSKKINIEKYIMQEFIDGKEFSVDCFLDKDGGIVAVIPRERLEVKSGLCSKTVTIEDNKLINETENILRNSGMIGPCNIQCIKKGGEYHFTEVNARIGGTYIASIGAGLDLNQYILDFIQDRNSEPLKSYKKNLFMIRHWEETFEDEHNI